MIPVFEPEVGEDDIAAVVDAMRRGEISGAFGEILPAFEEEFAKFVGTKYAVAVSNATTALHLTIAAAGIGQGDEVLTSASTNIASALCNFHNGAVTVPVDSEAVTWNLDLDLIESLITPRTRAIVAVHLYGHPVDMDLLATIAKKHKLFLVEDCAESHGATVRGKMTGGLGDAGCFSFYANKIMTTGEGGMITTNDRELAEKCKLLRNLGFTQPRFFHEVPAFNFRMTAFQAAMGRSQLAKIKYLVDGKRRVAHAYNRLLEGIPGLQLPPELDWAYNVYWMYGIVVESASGITRDKLTARLKQDGIDYRTFFCPMSQQPFLRAQPGYRDVKTPVADRLWTQGLYLPSSINLDDATLAKIAHSVRAAFGA